MTGLLPWLVLPAAALAGLLLLLLARRSHPQALPLADAPALRRAGRRTVALRIGLAVALVAVLAAGVALIRQPTDSFDELVPEGGGTVVVLDVSASVSDLVYREIARTMTGIVRSAGDEGRTGLVLFSDVAQEALPPGAPAAELRPFIRYFQPKSEPSAARKPSYYRNAGPGAPPPTPYPQNPWFRSFSGGTRISVGLEAARLALARDGFTSGRIVLLSDLAESEDDVGRLAGELARYARDPRLELRVVALPPATERETEVFERILGDPKTVVVSTELTARGGDGAPAGAFPAWFVALALLAAAALAVNERAAQPLDWRRPSREAA